MGLPLFHVEQSCLLDGNNHIFGLPPEYTFHVEQPPWLGC
jgi:hypothetical protein